MKKYYVIFPESFPKDFNFRVFYYNESLSYKHLYLGNTDYGITNDKSLKKRLNYLKQFLVCNNMNDHVIIFPDRKLYKIYLKKLNTIENSTYHWYTEDLSNMKDSILFDNMDKQYINRLQKD